MADTFTLISTTTTTTSTPTVTFSSIPQSFNDLKIVMSVRTDRSDISDAVKVRFNGDSTSNYAINWIYGDGSTTPSGGAAAVNPYTHILAPYVSGNNTTASAYSAAEVYISNYRSGYKKTTLSDGGSENRGVTGTNPAYQGWFAGLWFGTSAITSIALSPNVGANFLAYCTFSLYGISNS